VTIYSVPEDDGTCLVTRYHRQTLLAYSLTTLRTSASHTDDNDPVTASYNIYLTPQTHQNLYLLQYPNRPREQPYNHNSGTAPSAVRIKPESGYIEVDTELNTNKHFNRYQALKWGGAVKDVRDARGIEDSEERRITYGLASGLPSGQRVGAAIRNGLKDEADREGAIQDDMIEFDVAKAQGRTLHRQTLGGQIIQHDSDVEAGKPVYFVGAFRGDELHLSRMAGTVQMRPLFHHLDAEDQRTRIMNSTGGVFGAGADGTADGSARPTEKAKLVHQSYKQAPTGMANPRGELEEQSTAMRLALQTAAEEQWVPLEYVDEDDDGAFSTWKQRMFVQETENALQLKSSMDGEAYLDAVSGRPGSPSQPRKGKARRKSFGDSDGG
jgi:DNA-directed RNA polymerase III subunit RPC5